MAVGQVSERVIAVIQARMSSSRLPGKVLLPLPFPEGKPLIEQLILKLQNSALIDRIVVVTPTGEAQDRLVKHLSEINVDFLQGDENDVLSRFVSVVEKYQPATLIRITADNPFIDIALLEKCLLFHLDNGADYTLSNGLPYGMNMEIVKAAALLKLHNMTDLGDDEKEHVTSRFSKETGFNSQLYRPFGAESHTDIRVTVDTSQDYMRSALLYQLQGSASETGDLDFILDAHKKYPFIF